MRVKCAEGGVTAGSRSRPFREDNDAYGVDMWEGCCDASKFTARGLETTSKGLSAGIALLLDWVEGRGTTFVGGVIGPVEEGRDEILVVGEGKDSMS